MYQSREMIFAGTALTSDEQRGASIRDLARQFEHGFR
jgi:hypothetical protein